MPRAPASTGGKQTPHANNTTGSCGPSTAVNESNHLLPTNAATIVSPHPTPPPVQTHTRNTAKGPQGLRATFFQEGEKKNKTYKTPKSDCSKVPPQAKLQRSSLMSQSPAGSHFSLFSDLGRLRAQSGDRRWGQIQGWSAFLINT